MFNNTLNVQASQDSTEELGKRLNDLIPKESQNTSPETQNETETECSKRTTRKKNRPKSLRTLLTTKLKNKTVTNKLQASGMR